MDILTTAIESAGGVGKLAETLEVGQNVVSNWRARGVPKAWRIVLQLQYGEKDPEKALAPVPLAEVAINSIAACIESIDRSSYAGIKRRKMDLPVVPVAELTLVDRRRRTDERAGLAAGQGV